MKLGNSSISKRGIYKGMFKYRRLVVDERQLLEMMDRNHCWRHEDMRLGFVVLGKIHFSVHFRLKFTGLCKFLFFFSPKPTSFTYLGSKF